MALIRLLSLLLLLVYPTFIRGDNYNVQKMRTKDETTRATDKEIGELQSEFQKLVSITQFTLKTLASQERKIDELQSLHKIYTGKIYLPSSCDEIDGEPANGVYRIYPNTTSPVLARCVGSIGGGWTVIQKRFDGSVDFYRGWEEYAEGFGDPSGEYWLGLRHIHALTQAEPMELYVGVTDFNGRFRSANYSSFSVSSEREKFRLFVSGYSGPADDRLKKYNGQKFSTKDQDNDSSFNTHCSNTYHGAWWFRSCKAGGSHLNGRFSEVKVYNGEDDYMYWLKQIKSSVMMIRPNFRPWM